MPWYQCILKRCYFFRRSNLSASTKMPSAPAEMSQTIMEMCDIFRRSRQHLGLALKLLLLKASQYWFHGMVLDNRMETWRTNFCENSLTSSFWWHRGKTKRHCDKSELKSWCFLEIYKSDGLEINLHIELRTFFFLCFFNFVIFSHLETFHKVFTSETMA